jgi:osmotically-inducible protein OsmY
MSHRRRGVLVEYPNRLLLAVVAVAVLVGAASCSTTPRRTSEEQASDADIKAKVVSALKSDQNLLSEHIDVVIDRGVVQLKGFVYSDHERSLARTDAESVPGVQSVDIELDLMGGGISEASD